MQEQTRQQEQMTKIKEYEVHLEQMKVEQKRVEGEQKREYLKEEAKVAKHKAEYQVRTLMLCFIFERFQSSRHTRVFNFGVQFYFTIAHYVIRIG